MRGDRRRTQDPRRRPAACAEGRTLSSEAEANDAPPPDGDTCPFCLQFEGVAAARRAGERYCPLCGGDWAGTDAPVEVPAAFRSAP
ncbi:MAG: hypothetical protein KC583_18490, partial [Myxococcales bacterium]|nr:hypothetical protein [Myxococcales bacterium]